MCSISRKRLLIERDSALSIERQCELLDLSRSTYYYVPATESELNLQLMRLIDEQYLETPYYGVGMMLAFLRRLGHDVNVKRVRRLFRLMGLEALVPKPPTSLPAPGDHPEHRIYPYLLRGLEISRCDQVWSTDITYVPMPHGFMYLTAVIDWFSRFVLSWEISNSLESSFCCEVLRRALETYGTPEIFNTDQGSQYTSDAFTSILRKAGSEISMDGRGRAIDNVFVERLWRSYKYEYLYLCCPDNGTDLYNGTDKYMRVFNSDRPHSSLGGASPAGIYLNNANCS